MASAIDPICGMTVDPATALNANRDGELFYFCCDSCRQRFLADETNGSDVCCQEADRPGSRNAYICPMHPEVEQAEPGICPLCGMDLEWGGLPGEGDKQELADLRALYLRLFAALVVGAPVVVLAMGPMLIPSLRPFAATNVAHGIQLILTSLVVFGAGWPIWQRAYVSLVARSPNMFTLLAMGIGAAYFYSLTVISFPAQVPASLSRNGDPFLYFEAATMITMLVLLGQVLELKARRQTGSAIRELLTLTPATAIRIIDGEDVETAVEELQIGDRIRVRPGARIAVDGIVIEGRGCVDESMITGEPIPLDKETGNQVVAGTVNQSGAFVMESQRVGKETMLSHIVDLVAAAQRSRAPVQQLADRVAAYFVPTVMVVAVLTFLAWIIWQPLQPAILYAMVNAIAVLIIACPCALGLATPMSIMVAVGRGAQCGVLVRNAESLQNLARVDTLVIDKTGTVTSGKPTITEVIPADGVDQLLLLQLAAAAESNSEHPLARAVTDRAKSDGAAMPFAANFQSLDGFGVIADVMGQTILVGSDAFFRQQGIDMGGESINQRLAKLQDRGATVVHVAGEDGWLGAMAVTDPVKTDAAEAMAQIRKLGIDIFMLSGDDPRVVGHVATQLGISEYHGRVTPQDKKRLIEEWASDGRVVAMAGDGINDAPALATATVGIAMGNGTDVAMQSADVTLVRGDLNGLTRAIQLGRATIRNIRQNLFFAFAYNALGIPLAAGVLYPLFQVLLNPMFAALAMSLSSVSVIANALRLRSTPLR